MWLSILPFVISGAVAGLFMLLFPKVAKKIGFIFGEDAREAMTFLGITAILGYIIMLCFFPN